MIKVTNMNDKILSVVIPTYNMEGLLPRCLNSLLEPQKTDSLEILVVNDGSKDNSLKIAKAYEEKYPNIVKVIDKPNGNYGSTINKGIEVASGKYFKILDSDDFYVNSNLIKLVEKLKGTNADLVFTNYRRDKGKISVLFRPSQINYDKISSFDTLNLSNVVNFAMHGIAYKTSILKNNAIELSTGISYTDSEYCFYPLPFIKTYLAYDLTIYCYQLGRFGQTVNLSSQIKSISHMFRIIDRMYNDIKNRDFSIPSTIKQRKVFCDIINLCFSTILCYEKTNTYLEKLSLMDNKVCKVPGVKEVLLKCNMFGVKFYRRYHFFQKTSNSGLFTLYYNLVKIISYIIYNVRILIK